MRPEQPAAPSGSPATTSFVNQPPYPGAAPAPVLPPQPGQKRKGDGRGKIWLVGGVGLAVGLVAGVLIGQLDFSAKSEAFSSAITACGVEDADGILLGDEGQSISMQTEGAESFGAPYEDVACVLFELDIRDSVVSRIDSTRALDGRQEAEWDNYSASWGYHPDSGLDIVVEVNDEN